MSQKKNFGPANPLVPNVSNPCFSSIQPEKPISRVYREIDNDLASDSLENDIPAADLEDL